MPSAEYEVAENRFVSAFRTFSTQPSPSTGQFPPQGLRPDRDEFAASRLVGALATSIRLAVVNAFVLLAAGGQVGLALLLAVPGPPISLFAWSVARDNWERANALRPIHDEESGRTLPQASLGQGAPDHREAPKGKRYP